MAHHQPVDRLSTVGFIRSVLFVVNTVASANRLLDVVALFEADLRVQLVFTTPPNSTVTDGVAEVFAELDVLAIPWEQALLRDFDLAVTANHSGELHRLRAPVVIVSHGVGYSKKAAQSPESRVQSPAYGLSREWLLHNGNLVADTLVFAHEEQVARLAATVPEALPAAYVAGDPCFDRILASTGRRPIYRAALGCDDDTTLIVASSTWRAGSAFGSWPTFLRQLLAELPPEEFRVAAVLHPHVWHGHSPHQIRSWLADCVRAGLILVPPLEGWRAALIAADIVVGDHGAVTCYAAALDKPVVLAAFDENEIVGDTAVSTMVELADRLDRHAPLLPQLRAANATWPGVRELVSSRPGQAAHRLRSLFYQRLDLSEPDGGIVEPPLSVAGLETGTGVQAFTVTAEIESNATVRLRRRRTDVRPTPTGPAHLVVHADHPIREHRTNADILFTDRTDNLPALLAQAPGCRIVVSTTTGTATIRGRDRPVRLHGCDPLLAASALFAVNGEPPAEMRIVADGRAYSCTLSS
ncbi:hypothetical protein [Kutzneria sp. CA-103260]|uniref:hypothetical protein n=1 Tax=Kutzneria sp. CA-103260 TaxID=2802641 RepID=UPI001BA6DD4F|nr:hypothetical protein [Kutzneria sp. CA-103260]QUQ68101.1 hypothetical protein JJ691_58430 [Kutzneria sp. CA-103260]